MSSSSRGGFHVKARGRTIGPVSLEQLERLLRRGEVELADSVRDESETWCRLSELEALFPPEAEVVVEEREEPVQPVQPGGPPPPPGMGGEYPGEMGQRRSIGIGWIIGGGVAVILVAAGLFFVLSGGEDADLSDTAVASAEPAPGPETAGNEPANKRPKNTADKPVDKPVEKPAEKKPAEKKPAEKKPAEPKPAEPKPAEPKPAAKKPAVTKDRGNKKLAESGPAYVVKRFLDLGDTRRLKNYRLPLASLPGAPSSVAKVSGLSLVGADLMDDLVETETGDGGRSLVVRGTMPAGDGCSATQLVPIVRFAVDDKGAGCYWSEDDDVVKRFLPQLQWCGLSFRVGGDQVHYVGLRKPLVLKPPLPRLAFKDQEYRLPLKFDQVTEKVAGQSMIDGARIESGGKPLCRIVTGRAGNRSVSFMLDDVRRFLADRGEVGLVIEREDDLQRVFLRIRLVPEWGDLRNKFRDERKELARLSSVARLAGSTATKSGGKKLVMSSNEGVRSFIQDTLNLDPPGVDAGRTKLAEFARQVASGAAKVIKANKARVRELMKDEKQLELSRKQLVGAVVRLRLLTRLRHRGSTIHIPRLSL